MSVVLMSSVLSQCCLTQIVRGFLVFFCSHDNCHSSVEGLKIYNIKNSESLTVDRFITQKIIYPTITAIFLKKSPFFAFESKFIINPLQRFFRIVHLAVYRLYLQLLNLGSKVDLFTLHDKWWFLKKESIFAYSPRVCNKKQEHANAIIISFNLWKIRAGDLFKSGGCV